MRKLIAIVALSSIAVACGTKTVVVEQTTPPTQETVPATLPVQRDPQTDFLNGMTSTHPYEVSKMGKAAVLEMGRLACGAIDEGATIEDFAEMAVRNDVDGGFIGALIRESVMNFCPDNQWFIDSALNA